MAVAMSQIGAFDEAHFEIAFALVQALHCASCAGSVLDRTKDYYSTWIHELVSQSITLHLVQPSCC